MPIPLETGEVAETTVLHSHRRLSALKSPLFNVEVVDTTLHNPVSTTIFGDRFDEAIREKADNLQALHRGGGRVCFSTYLGYIRELK